jgi:membrane protease YdiL (CAAX protease family)
MLRPMERTRVGAVRRAGVPVGSLIGMLVTLGLVVAALVPPARPVVLVALGLAVVRAPIGTPMSWAASAGLPVAVILVWGAIVGAQARDDLRDCADLLSPPAVTRIAEALLVIGIISLLSRRMGVGLPSLGLARPTRPELLLGVVALTAIPLASLLLGSALAEPFFGPIRLHLADPAALVPAFGLAIANGVMEELAYRGALMCWLSRAANPLLGLLAQAAVFGAAHTGSDYVGDAWPVILVVAAGGLLAGLVTRRTGSLWLPIAVHIGLDVPLYYAAVCRLPAAAPG